MTRDELIENMAMDPYDAAALLDKIEPVIREQVAQEIEEWGGTKTCPCPYCAGKRQAAGIARRQS